jgi:hypothetical protein
MKYENIQLADPNTPDLTFNFFNFLKTTAIVDISQSDFDKIKTYLEENSFGNFKIRNMRWGYLNRHEWRGTSGVGKKSIEIGFGLKNEGESYKSIYFDSRRNPLEPPPSGYNHWDTRIEGNFSPQIVIVRTDDDWYYIYDTTDNGVGAWKCDEMDGVIEVLKSYRKKLDNKIIKNKIIHDIQNLDDEKILKLAEFIKRL